MFTSSEVRHTLQQYKYNITQARATHVINLEQKKVKPKLSALTNNELKSNYPLTKSNILGQNEDSSPNSN